MTDAEMRRNIQAQLLALHAQAMTLGQASAAIATQAEAMLHLLETLDPAPECVTSADGVCQHPLQKRRDMSTFGLKRFRCGACGETVTVNPEQKAES